MNRRPDDDPGLPEGVESARSRARAAAELQELGERLVRVNAKALAAIPLDEPLREAVALARRLRPRTEALRRQLQHIGRLMRQTDAPAIAAALDRITLGRAAAELQREAEQWRDRLLGEGDPALLALLTDAQHPERQRLRQLVRRVAKRAPGTPARAAGEVELCAELRRLLAGRSAP